MKKAQSKVEAHHFEIRKQLLKYDDVMNDQRQVIFAQRKEIMQADEVQETVREMRYDAIDQLVAEAIPADSYAENWDGALLTAKSRETLGLDIDGQAWTEEDGVIEAEITQRLQQLSDSYMAEKAVRFSTDVMRMAEKSLLLQVLDQLWKEHLLQLEQLRQGISLRAYAQKDPLNEYKREAFFMFDAMLDRLRSTVTMALSHVEIRPPEAAEETAEPAAATEQKISRNSPCPCGSGRKYKHCHGKHDR